MYKYPEPDDMAQALACKVDNREHANAVSRSPRMRDIIKERTKIYHFSHKLKNNNIVTGNLICRAEIVPCGTTWTVGKIEFSTAMNPKFTEALDEPYFKFSAMLEDHLFNHHKEEIEAIWNEKQEAA